MEAPLLQETDLPYCVFSDEEDVFGLKNECRICHALEFIEHMEAPCNCRGTIKFAHRNCVQSWCNAKATTTCEICNQPEVMLDCGTCSDVTWESSSDGQRPRAMIAPQMFRLVAARPILDQNNNCVFFRVCIGLLVPSYVGTLLTLILESCWQSDRHRPEVTPDTIPTAEVSIPIDREEGDNIETGDGHDQQLGDSLESGDQVRTGSEDVF
ncbi:hypothetical protein Ddye_008077 [Dipteronia dyeriana]|uniref:RING-CH-type domain-containing protein n=1 Tax=Dipteronia dyeriana TaxID=168575 RepID=A0AAD9X944_9ROSI|nr:hypothetical protein Ddye_008077 [Dipteronia dyeriana]